MKLNNKYVVFIIFSPLLAPRHILMLKSLKAQGWKTAVIVWDRKGDALEPQENREMVDKWIWIHHPATEWRFKLIPKLPQFYAKILAAYKSLGCPSVVVITHIFLLPLVFCFPGIKFYDAYEMYALGMSFYFGSYAQKVLPLWQTLEGYFVRKVDGIYTLDSRDGWLEKYYKNWNKRVQVIWNVPAKQEEPSRDEVEALKSEFLHKKVISYVGGMTKGKGLIAAIEAAALVRRKHPDVLFLFIGALQDDSHKANSLIQYLQLENNIRFINWLPYRKMLAYLAYARVGIALHQPGRHYQYISSGTGRKFLTYMQAGIPIVAPTIGEMGLIISKEGCGIRVDTTNNTLVANTINYLLDNPIEANLMGQKGRKAFLEKYCWEIEEHKFIKFYNNIINKSDS